MEGDHPTDCCTLFNIYKIAECLLEMVQAVDICKINFTITKLRSILVGREKCITRFGKNGYVATNSSGYSWIRIDANGIGCWHNACKRVPLVHANFHVKSSA